MDRNRPRAGDQSGFALIEVIVSAAVLGMIALAVLAGIEGSQNSAARERARSVAAAVAEQDQERMRAMSVQQLSDLGTQTRTVNVNNIDYTVESSSSWITDESGGTTSCVNNSPSVDYLRINTKVTSAVVGRNVPPVGISSLVAPPVGREKGSLAVQVYDRDGVGKPGIAVTISGPSSAPGATTNEFGCAIFQRIDVGTYTATLSSPGDFVNKLGERPATKGAEVTAGTVQVISMDWDQAASNITLDTRTQNPVGNAEIPNSSAPAVTAVNAGEPTLRKQLTSSPAGGFFPFKSPYFFYTGTCDQSNPTSSSVLGAGYLSTTQGQNASKVLDRAAAARTVTIHQPPLALRVTSDGKAGVNYSSSSNRLAIYAELRPEAGDPNPCAEPVYGPLRTTTNASAPTSPYDQRAGWASNSVPGYDPGLPFGVYDVCVQGYFNSRWRYNSSTLVVDNRTINGAPLQTVTLNGSSSTTKRSPCP